MPVALAGAAAEDAAGLLDSLLGAHCEPMPGGGARAEGVFPAAEGVVPIHAVRYDERVRILGVDFVDGARYHFLDVPEPVYLGLAGASSVTAYFREHVAGRYAFRRLE